MGIALLACLLSGAALSAQPVPGVDWHGALLEAEKDARGAAVQAQADWARAVQAMRPAEELRALVALTLDYDRLEELEHHADLIERGVALARQQRDAEAGSWFGELQARALADEGRQAQALNAFQQLVDQAERESLARRPWVYVAQGDAFGNVGQRYQALRAHSRAYDIFEAEGDRLGMATALTGIAGAHADGADADSQALAHRYVERALALVDPAQHPRMAMVLNLRRGVTLQRQQRLAESRPQLERAMQMAEDLHMPREVAQARYFLAKQDLQEDRAADALRQLDLALPVFREQREKLYNVAAASVRGRALARLARKPEAMAALAEGERLLPATHNPKAEAFFRLAAARVYGDAGEERLAYEQLLALREVERGLADDANAQLAEEMKVKFGVELQQRENALLRAEQAQDETRRWGLLAALGCVIALLGALVLLLHKRAVLARSDAAHQAALAQAQSEANNAKSAFLASMSHELRTPLNAVLGYAQLLQWDRSASEKTLDGARIIEQSGRHLLSLIEDTLNLARIEAGRLELNAAPLAFEPFLQGVADLIRVRAGQKRIGFELQAEGLPAGVLADERQLRQVLLNLLGNAVKFTDSGGVVLRARRLAHEAGEEARVRFEVQDSGVGITAEELPVLFQPFQQVGAQERRSAGTGLGLAISQQIVKLMGGEITVTSTPGHGSVFAFELALPLAEAPATAPPAPARPVGYEGRRRELLVIDDVAANRALIADALRPLGFVVHEAGNGREGLARAAALRPDLIVIDNEMPVLGGLETTRRLRRLPGMENVALLAVSASASPQDRADALAAGATDFLPKPVEMDRLLALLEQHLQLRFSEVAP